MLLGMFGMVPLIPLKEICDMLLDIAYSTAVRKARINELPFPTMRLGDSQKAKCVVHINDLAAYIDNENNHARAEWKRAQV